MLVAFLKQADCELALTLLPTDIFRSFPGYHQPLLPPPNLYE
jgi:hypothetical protein